MNAPLDARQKVKLKAELTDAQSYEYYWIGMEVYCEEDGKYYQLTGEPTTDIANWKVRETSQGGGGTFEQGLTVNEPVGGLKVGDEYAAGDTLEQLLRDMLDPLKYPILTNPTASMSVTSGQTLLESGTQSANITVKVDFNRGKIEPKYNTSGYRAGEATSYTVDGVTKDDSNIFDLVITPTKTSFSGSVAYAQGEQPKDSKGKDYDVPLPASSVNTNTVSAKFVSAFWSNVADITNVAKLALFDYTATKSKQYDFPAATVANPETFDIPASLNVTKIEVKSDLSGLFEDCSAEFTKTTVTHPNANNEDENYNRYTDNRGYNAGARTIRVTWA